MNGKVLTDDDGRLYTGQDVLYREKGVTALDVQRAAERKSSRLVIGTNSSACTSSSAWPGLTSTPISRSKKVKASTCCIRKPGCEAG